MMDDYSQRFIFEDTDIRGEFVHLQDSFKAVLGTHDYPPEVASLLGEFLSAAVLLGSTIKFDGRLVLQARGDEGTLMVAEAQHDGSLRGIARLGEGADTRSFQSLLGKGMLVITIEPAQGQSYQSLVPLTGESLAECLAFYFFQSEQLATKIWLSADLERAGGLLLQQLPRQLVRDQQARARQWEHVTILAGTTTRDELLELPAQTLLQRLYVEDSLQLMARKEIAFACTCSAQRTANALVLLGEDEVNSIFAEMAEVVMDCEFCGAQYRFSRESLAITLGSGETFH